MRRFLSSCYCGLKKILGAGNHADMVGQNIIQKRKGNGKEYRLFMGLYIPVSGIPLHIDRAGWRQVVNSDCSHLVK